MVGSGTKLGCAVRKSCKEHESVLNLCRFRNMSVFCPLTCDRPGKVLYLHACLKADVVLAEQTRLLQVTLYLSIEFVLFLATSQS